MKKYFFVYSFFSILVQPRRENLFNGILGHLNLLLHEGSLKSSLKYNTNNINLNLLRACNSAIYSFLAKWQQTGTKLISNVKSFLTDFQINIQLWYCVTDLLNYSIKVLPNFRATVIYD